ncbi:MAG: hypothetical protein V1800_18655 [Candidatus Latescibacterota bacterium]
MEPNWVLSLEQQADLTVSSGGVSDLAGAVRRGADLRLYMTTDLYEETLYFQQTYAGEGAAFAGIMSHHHSYVHRGQDIREPYISIFKYDTSGAFCQVKWMWNDVRMDESQAYPYGVYRWFVCDRWRAVYEHDAEGNRLQGDLEELKEHIRQGRSIQVGIRQLFGLAQDATDGPPHISFATTMQPVIRDGHVQSNCDLVAIGAPKWPCTWRDGLHAAVMLPSTSGEIICFLAQPGNLPFERIIRRRAMQWMVAEMA